LNEFEILTRKIKRNHPHIVKIYSLHDNVNNLEIFSNETAPNNAFVALEMKKYSYDVVKCMREFNNKMPLYMI